MERNNNNLISLKHILSHGIITRHFLIYFPIDMIKLATSFKVPFPITNCLLVHYVCFRKHSAQVAFLCLAGLCCLMTWTVWYNGMCRNRTLNYVYWDRQKTITTDIRGKHTRTATSSPNELVSTAFASWYRLQLRVGLVRPLHPFLSH